MAEEEGSKHSWSHSFWQFFDPIDTCLVGWFCPCVLFGKTQARLADPSLKDYSPVNENCLIWCGLSCFHASAVIQTIKRRELRKKYGITNSHLETFLKKEQGYIQKQHNIEGSAVEDFLGACFCRCCGLIQEEKEVVLRQQSENTNGYKTPQEMTYP